MKHTPYSQRDLVYLYQPFTLPDGKEMRHPVLIISADRVNMAEKNAHYTGVMMSATSHIDKYTFECLERMFEQPFKPGS